MKQYRFHIRILHDAWYQAGASCDICSGDVSTTVAYKYKDSIIETLCIDIIYFLAS